MPAQRISVLPRSCPPRGLNRAQSAEYIGVSPALFDEMVRDGRMPPPVKFNSKKVWDREKLDQAFATHGEEEDNPFDAIRRSHGEAAAQIRRR
jgi:predicted DNA-binding transcriptional regulator AlpA